MKKMKVILLAAAAAALFWSGSDTAIAATYNSPAEITAELTGRTIDDIIREHHDTGESYCNIADSAGKLDEFRQSCLALKEDALQEYVEDGLLTQTEADEILAMIEEHMASVCDGSLHNGVSCNGTICNSQLPSPNSGYRQYSGHHGSHHGGRHHR